MKIRLNRKKKKILFVILLIIFIASISYIGIFIYNGHKEKNVYKGVLENIKIDRTLITDDTSERMLKLKELQKENSDIVAWLEIKNSNINYPILQSSDNDYYLNHNYKKENAATGSLFLDYREDINSDSNLLIYGHRNKYGLMFDDLYKYSVKDFYQKNKTFKFTTADNDYKYEVISVFFTKIYNEGEEGFRYYNYINIQDENEFNSYVDNVKRRSIYKIDSEVTYGDKLLTLSTCEYSQDDGRFVVVAKMIDSIRVVTE